MDVYGGPWKARKQDGCLLFACRGLTYGLRPQKDRCISYICWSQLENRRFPRPCALGERHYGFNGLDVTSPPCGAYPNLEALKDPPIPAQQTDCSS